MVQVNLVVEEKREIEREIFYLVNPFNFLDEHLKQWLVHLTVNKMSGHFDLSHT